MENFRFLARFNQWVNERLYSVVAALPDDEYRREMGAYFGSVHRTLNHILVIDRMQLCRFTGDSVDDIAAGDTILHASFADLQKARETMDRHIILSVDGLDESVLGKTYTFTAKATGRKVSMIGRHILLAMFNHQTHHRGQVHCMLTQLGHSVPPLDVPVFASPPPAA